MIVSLSTKIVFCISALILSYNSSFSKIFSSSFNISLRPPPKTLVTSGTTLNLSPGLLSLISNASCLRLVYFFQSLLFYIVLLRACILHIHIAFVFFSSSIKSGLLDVVAFRKLNSKSHTSFA